MQHELFVEQPVLELKEGIKVDETTEIHYQNGHVEQVLKDLTLETIRDDEGSNGFNSYHSKTYLSLKLNPGDIILFNESKGYYLPPYPTESIPDAISDMSSLEGIPRFIDREW